MSSISFCFLKENPWSDGSGRSRDNTEKLMLSVVVLASTHIVGYSDEISSQIRNTSEPFKFLQVSKINTAFCHLVLMCGNPFQKHEIARFNHLVLLI